MYLNKSLIQSQTFPFKELHYTWENDPLNTWRNNNVVITSKRRHFDVIQMTSFWRNNDVIIA